MTQFVKPIQFGSLTLPTNVFYSPLAGCSDFPFRKMAAKYRPGLIYCEMVKMDALVRNDPNTFRMLDYDHTMHPIGAQLCGSKVSIAAESAKILEEMGFDVIDLNCGCPVDKVTKDGSGSGLLKEPGKIGELLNQIINAVKIPVTIKVRAGWDEEHINVAEVTRIAEEAGAVAIAVHGRTRKQAYRGPANWDYIKEAVDAAKTIKVIGNGDVFDAEAALALFKHTGCDAVLASRGTMGGPWIADDIYRLDAGLPIPKRDIEAERRELIEHFEYMKKYLPTRRLLVDMRRVGCWYIKKSPRTREFRGAISKVRDLDELYSLLTEFSFNNTPSLLQPV